MAPGHRQADDLPATRRDTTTKEFDPATCDLLYVLTDDWDRYLVPTSAITAKRNLALGRRVSCYRVDP